jgi:glycosyltransferase involved in cell wall biosynthesis
VSRQAARAGLGLTAAEVAVGVFSPRAAGFNAAWLASGAAALAREPAVRWIFFGAGSDAPPDGFPARPGTLCLGWLAPERASAVFAALDVAAAPFDDGLTLRRSSAMAALAHGVPLVSSRGPLFDPALEDAAVCAEGAGDFAEALRRLVTDAGLRERQGRRGREIYERSASVEVLAARVLSDLGGAP